MEGLAWYWILLIVCVCIVALLLFGIVAWRERREKLQEAAARSGQPI